MKGKKILQIVPETIIFRDLDVGESESFEVFAKNLSRKPMKIRFSLPPNSPFEVDQTKSNIIPPGLEAKTMIHYKCIQNSIEKDVLKVECDELAYDIAVIAYPPSETLKITPEKFDFGTITSNSIINQKFSIRNIGQLDTEFTAYCSSSDIVDIQPQTSQLKSRETLNLNVCFHPIHSGKIDFPIFFKTPKNDKSAHIQLMAEVIEPSLIIKQSGKEISELNFEHVYFGQKKIFQIEIFNNCPCKRSFVFNAMHDSNTNTHKSDEKQETPIFQSLPSEGILPAYERTAISVIFQPQRTEDMNEDIEYMFTETATVEIVETNKITELSLAGIGVRPSFELSQIDFNFDYKKVYSQTIKTLEITNKNEFLPLTFDISQVAHFRFSPMNGVIRPKASKKIEIMFFPKNIGDFEEVVHILFNNGLIRRHINVLGNSLLSSDEPKAFIRTELYETDETTHFNALHPDTRFGLNLDQINRNNEMRKQFDDYIHDSMIKREENAKQQEIKEKATKNVEFYLSRSGLQLTDEELHEMIEKEIEKTEVPQNSNLKEPTLKKMHMNDNLVIQTPEKFGLISQNEKKPSLFQKRYFDDHTLIKNKFKANPTTPPEINECSRQLTPTQQLLISTSHQSINFGVVSVCSSESRSFSITNNLEQYICAEFNYGSPELQQSTPVSQVIPPMQTAGFDITFSTREPMNFSKTITFIINKKHEYLLNIIAQAIPIDLKVSRSTIEFKFANDTIDPFIKEYIQIHNTSNSIAEFQWDGLDSPHFVISPLKGKIDPHSAYNVEFIFKPGSVSHVEQYVNLNVVGGPSKKVRLIGDVGKPKLSVSKKTVQFGLIPVGVEKSIKIRLRNSSPDDAIYSITSNCPKTMTISQLQGRIASGDYKSLTFTVNCDTPQTFSYNATVTVCGGNTINLILSGQSELPQISLSTENLNFGKQFLGSSSSKKLKLINTGQIPAALNLDLTGHPEFHLEYDNSYSNISPNDDSQNSIFLKTDEVSTLYQFTIQPQTEIEFDLVFHPEKVGQFNFPLHFSIVNSSITKSELIEAESIKSPLILSATFIHFGLSSVTKRNNPNGRPVIKELKLKNNSPGPIFYHFKNDHPNFTIDKPEGLIQYSDEIIIFISFKPNKAQPVNYHLPLYVKAKENDEEIEISKIQLTGIGTSRQFTTSTNYLCLPIVPLNTKIERSIQLINSAFIDTTISIHTTLNDKQIPLAVILVGGNQLKHTEAFKPISVSFQSSKPISFSTVIAITSDFGDSYSFTVTATTDNSVFTLYPYFSVQNPNIENDYIANFLMTSDYLKFENEKGPINTEFSEFIKRILNSLLLSSPILNYPEDIANSDGSQLFDIIDNLSGNRKPNFHLKNDKIENFENLLKYLISCGCLLSSLKPEFLLSKSDFLHFMRNKLIDHVLGLDYFNAPDKTIFKKQNLTEFTSSQSFVYVIETQIKAIEKIYDQLSLESYSFLIMQILKVFVLSKCDVTKYGQTSHSNYFSNIELNLLKWINLQGSFDFKDFSQLNNVETYTTVIQKTLNTMPGENLMNTLKDLRMNFLPTKNEILNGNQVIQCFIWYQLYQTLPFYLATSNLEFATILNKPITQSVSITNPSKTEILYTAKFEGSENFVGLNETVTLLPLQTIEYPIEYLANTHIIEKCKLVLIPSKPYRVQSKNSFKPLQSLPSSRQATPKQSSRSIKPSPRTPTKSALPQIESSKQSPLSLTQLQANNQLQLNLQFNNSMKKGGDSNKIIMKNRPKTAISMNSPKTNNTTQQTSRSITSNGESKNGSMPLFATPIVVNLYSNVEISQPLQSFKIEGKVYEQASMKIDIESPIPSRTKFRVYTKSFRIIDENNKILDKSPISKQMADFLMNPTMDFDLDSDLSQFDQLLNTHQPFLISSDELMLPLSNEEEFKVEFNPISLGTYRCLVLFLSEKGEFVYEIIAKATLPLNFTTNTPTMKCECLQSTTLNIQLDVVNTNLIRSMAHSIEKVQMLQTKVNERKLKELVAYRVRELQNIFIQNFKETLYKCQTSYPSTFSIPSDVSINKIKANEVNAVAITFSPEIPGEYPVKVLLSSQFDVRVYPINGIALATTKIMEIGLQTIAGKEIIQEIPINNPSNQIWSYRVSCSNPKLFDCESKFEISPKSTYGLQLTFLSNQMGVFETDLTIVNVTKEQVVVFKLKATVQEPPAEKVITIKCRAREKFLQKLDLPPFVRKGLIKVTADVPFLECAHEIEYSNRKPKNPFEFSIYALRSGITAGTLTFTEVTTKVFCWYVIECLIEEPLPEQTIQLHCEARKTLTIEIPLSNDKDFDVDFDVEYADTDFFGPRQFTVPANSKDVYRLIFSPLKEQKRISAISFNNPTIGEFIFTLDLTVDKPEKAVLRPLECSIGKTISTVINLDNPLSRTVSFNYENDNQMMFQLNCDDHFQLNSHESKTIELTFCPLTVGFKETASIVFKSPELGEYLFNVIGIGKPPQPLSPTIIETSVNTSNSMSINFSNPFKKPTKFSVALNCEQRVFSFLSKRRSFTLETFNQIESIPFVFSPKTTGQFKANMVISQNNIQWIYPIIGNSTHANENDAPYIFGQSGEPIDQLVKMPIVGEKEEFSPTDYTFNLSTIPQYDFVLKLIEISQISIQKENNIPTISCHLKFLPKRPYNFTIRIQIENPLKQKWLFSYTFDIQAAKPLCEFCLECVLNKQVHHSISLKEKFTDKTPFHAYFANGSASEFSVTKSKGFIEPTLNETVTLPFDVCFKPVMYGKVLKGLLVIDTLEAQWMFEYSGKVPDYVPPNLAQMEGRLENNTPESVLYWKEICKNRKKNIIKDNIDSARITRPKSPMVRRFKA